MFPPTLKQKQKSKVFRHGFRLLVLVLLIQQAWQSDVWYVYSLCYLPCNKASRGVKEQLLSFGDAQYYKLPGSKDACCK